MLITKTFGKIRCYCTATKCEICSFPCEAWETKIGMGICSLIIVLQERSYTVVAWLFAFIVLTISYSVVFSHRR